MDNDEFVKLIRKIGKIKPVEEAFKEFPVEEEEHKGRIDSYLKNKNFCDILGKWGKICTNKYIKI